MSQLDALKFADTLEQIAALFGCPAALLQSAAELRRLHAEQCSEVTINITSKKAMM